MKTLSIDLVAGERKNIYALANFLHILETTAAIDIEFINGGNVYGTALQVEFGLKAKPEGGFTELGFTSATTQTIKIYIGVGDGSYDRITGNVALLNQQGAKTNTQKSVTNAAKTIVAANTARRSLFVQNNSTTAVMRLKLDGTAASATSGVRIQPGQYFEDVAYCASGAISACMETADATANNVEVVEG